MIPEIMTMFDSSRWKRDIGDNSQFWRPARVIRWYNDPGYSDTLVDVEFLPEKRISTGHFWDSHPHNQVLTWI
jgi:hypothetical protein